MTIPTLPEGELYGVNDPESFSAEDPWTAIEEYLDGACGWSVRTSPAEAEAAIRECCPLHLAAYKRDTVSADEIKRWADDLTEDLSEKWGDEYGDPDGNYSLPDDADEIMLQAVTKIVGGMQVWRCDKGGEVELDADAVVEWARQMRPDWFCGSGRATPRGQG